MYVVLRLTLSTMLQHMRMIHGPALTQLSSPCSFPCAELWEQTDGVKTLQRSKLLATVVRERHSQLAQQTQQHAASQAAEAAFLEQQKQTIQVCS